MKFDILSFFKLKENKTNLKTEIIAGFTTFATMAYILAVNPSILGEAGMDSGAVFTATALSAFITTLLMAFLSNYPVALAPAMGLNAYFAYTVVQGMGYSWQMALAAVFVEGVIFILLSITNVREAIFNSIPKTLKQAFAIGTGLFIAFIGLKNAGIVVPNDSNYITMFSFGEAIKNGTFQNEGISALLALIGIIISAVLLAKNVQGNILVGIIITWILGIICQLAGIYVPNVERGFASLIPSFDNFSIPSLAPTFMQMDFSRILSIDFIVVTLSFLFVDLFDTIGTLIGVSVKADLLDEDGKLPRIKGALLSDAIGTTVGAALGTSTVSSYVESAAGVSAGGRTGLASVVTAVLFLLSLLLAPLFLAVPSFATAPALVIVGFLMVGQVTKLDTSDLTEAIPAYLCIIAMTFMSSIGEGISFGIISYIAINLLCRTKKKISIVMYVVAVLYILKYIFL